jgi:predicted ribosome quality control (RQC) complex YloA/Tae2 family protein
MEFSSFSVTQYGSAAKTVKYTTFGELTDAFFAENERREREKQRAYATEKLMKNAEARLMKKLELQQKELEDTEKKSEYKQKEDLITANIYRFSGKNERITVIDYIDDGNGGYLEKEVELKIERGLTAAEAAQRLYKKYNKAKNAEIEISAQIKKGEEELQYVRSVLDALSRCEGQSELDEIRLELTEARYIKSATEEKKKATSKGKKPQNTPKQLKSPLKFTTSTGLTVLVGKNNLQNDYLTFKVAAKNDWWFHVKSVPGSHTVLLADGREPSDEELTEAAVLAAKNSKAADQDKVLVDFTRIKNVKKPSGARPGYVIYEGYRTALVSPKSAPENGENL